MLNYRYSLPPGTCFFVFYFGNTLHPLYLLDMANHENPQPNEPVFSEIQMQEYQRAFAEEFTSREEARKAPITDIEELRQPAYDAIEYTLRHSQNESLKTKTAQWVLDKLLDDANRKEDKLLTFLEGMPTTEVSS